MALKRPAAGGEVCGQTSFFLGMKIEKRGILFVGQKVPAHHNLPSPVRWYQSGLKRKVERDRKERIGTMIEADTIKLLRECDAGINMGAAAIEDVLKYVHDEKLRDCLADCKAKHEKLKDEIQTLLEKYHDEGKTPNPMAKGMSWIKTNVKLAMNESDQTIADLITDGCNMGVKSLNRYLNQYQAAEEKTKDIAKRLIKLEEKLSEELRSFL